MMIAEAGDDKIGCFQCNIKSVTSVASAGSTIVCQNHTH